jgi:uncharacterized damage-inducible protein DinB
MTTWNAYRDDIVFSFRKHKEMAEKAVAQLDDDLFLRRPGEHSNSVAIIVKHMAGNLESRWTDFLTSDGDKPWRDRDAEFSIGPDDTRAHLRAAWDRGWGALFQALAALQESDWTRTVLIRGEPHSVMQAIHRALTHAAYHTGQIVYLARLLQTGAWTWITIPPGQSKEHGRRYLQS